jgi:NADP-dependent 3-hydroxy acid dehydrogenase YdfG
VCLWDIDQRRLVKSASELSALGRTIQAEVDVADAVSVAAAFGATVKALGRIDILVNTVPAGVLPCSRLALAHMAERGSGRIVNVGAAGAAGSPEAAGAMAGGVMAGGVMVIDVAAGADAGEILSAVVR